MALFKSRKVSIESLLTTTNNYGMETIEEKNANEENANGNSKMQMRSCKLLVTGNDGGGY